MKRGSGGQLLINSIDGYLSLFSLDRLAGKSGVERSRELMIEQYAITAPPHGPYVVWGRVCKVYHESISQNSACE